MLAAALALALGGAALATGPAAQASPAATTGASQERGQPTPLAPELEKERERQARELYGDGAQRPVEERRTSLITLGDSEISGEGVGTYEPGTDGPDNWCHRSPDAAVHRTGIPVQETFNVACSGANSENIRIGGTPQYADELVQSDSLAVTARNTRLKQVVLVAGANDDLQFGPVMTDCVTRWFLRKGACQPVYEPGWQQRVDGLVPKVERTVTDLKSVMRDAGYADGDYQLVVMSYPSPIGPDIEDNPDFPGKLPGGCTGYTSDSGWGRNTAVPAFEKGVRAAAENTGADYLDASRLFHGHEVCMEDAWARGLYVELSNPFPPDENSVRQSFHPNARGHAAFASCLTQMYETARNGSVREASCADPSGRGEPRLYQLAWDDAFVPLRSSGTGECLAPDGGSTRDGTAVRGQECAPGERAQTWWYDEDTRALRTGLTHDRCLDVPEGRAEPGTELVLWNCSAETQQRFLRQDGTFRPVAAPDLCLTLDTTGAPTRLTPCTDSPNQHFT
nr:ricin-type beta-trefoil lectin domain protein [Streptomyces sp. HNM0574]